MSTEHPRFDLACATARTALVVVTATPLLLMALPSSASTSAVIDLRSATPFALLSTSTINDAPSSSITGNVGDVSSSLQSSEVKGTSYTTGIAGATGSTVDAALLTAVMRDASIAFTNLSSLPPTSSFATVNDQLGGESLIAGVYTLGAATTSNLASGRPLILDGGGDPNSIFVFQVSSNFVTSPGSNVQLANGAQACNVFWEVGGSANVGAGSTFVGTLIATSSVTIGASAEILGRVFAQHGSISLASSTVALPATCRSAPIGQTLASSTLGTIPNGAPDTGTRSAPSLWSIAIVQFGIGAIALSGAMALIGSRRQRGLRRTNERRGHL